MYLGPQVQAPTADIYGVAARKTHMQVTLQELSIPAKFIYRHSVHQPSQHFRSTCTHHNGKSYNTVRMNDM